MIRVIDLNLRSKLSKGIKQFNLALLLSSSIVPLTFAETSVPEIDTQYLNNLTAPKVTWEKATDDDTGSDVVFIGGSYYRYTYNTPENYKDDFAAGNIKADFVGIEGGALSNYNYTSDVTGDFVGNYVDSGSSNANGGAIYNSYNIDDITSNFTGNSVYGSYAYGGAIYNSMGIIDDITGNFVANYAEGNNYAYGGAIYNYGISNIDDVTGNFIGNWVDSNDARGGAIYNDYNGLLGKITGDFIDNGVYGNNYAYGGAIYNVHNIDDITGDFIGNLVEGNSAAGGAFYSESGNVDDLSGNFSYNAVYGSNNGSGGAIYNNSKIDNVTGDFTGNYVEADNAVGGAVYNNGEMPLIEGDFYGNVVYGSSALGGAVYNQNYLGDLKGDFVANIAEGGNSSGGGAIFNAGGNINDIIGDFSENYAKSNSFAAGGAIVNSGGVIDDIVGDFTENHAQGYEASGGAIYNQGINIDDVTGDFSGNYAQGVDYASGGAIHNENLLGDVTGDFNDNYASGDEARGGAIYNYSYLGDLSGNFSGNHALSTTMDGRAAGGVLYNAGGNADDISGDFRENYVQAGSEATGGVIANFSNIDDISGNFAGNYALATGNNGWAAGGVIFGDGGNIDDITGVFSDNYALATGNNGRANGGAISGYDNVISLLNSSFYNNYAKGSEAYGGAIAVGGSDLYITADNGESIFSGNYVEYANGNGTFTKKSNAIDAYGGTVNLYAVNDGVVRFDDGIILDDVELNIGGDDSGSVTFNGLIEATDSVVNQTGTNVYFGGDSTIKGYAYNISGGSLNDAVIDDDGELHATNSAKINNLLAYGGALIDLDAGTVLTGDVKFDIDATLQGNFDYSKIFDEIIEETGSLTLEGGINTALNQNSLVNTAEDKSLVLSNGDFEVGTGAKEVSGWKELNVVNNATVKLVADVDTTSYINSDVLNLSKDSVLDLAGNSPLIATIDSSVNNDGHLNFNHATDSADDVTTIKGNYKAYKNAMMTIDVDPVTNASDKLVIEGDVEGRTQVVINPLSDDLSTGKALFVEAMNDDLSTGAYFDVYRVIGDAHKWNTLYEDNKWYAATDNIIATSQSGYGTVKDEELVLGGNTDAGDTNITQPKPQVVAEAIAYMSLPRIGLEQTKDLMRVVSNKVTSTKIRSGHCGTADCSYDGKALNGVWIDLGHKKSDIDAPVAVEAKINAVDLGFDIQKDLHNRLGIFASYRQGEYELSGDGEDYYSKIGSDINIDSWILGLYHRYDYGRLWTMSSIYGGIQKVDMSTDDGVSADTDGMQFGGSIEAGLVFEPQKRLTIEPSIRLGYNFIKYDDMSDAYGKTAEYDNVQNIEAEAGVKVEKTWFMGKNNIAKLYVKPSIIQNFGKGDVNITSLDTVEGLENETLIRGEVGGSFNFGNGWSGFGAVGYTYGSDYNATDFNVGVNYNW